VGALTVFCVWTGDKYPRTYVERLQSMVARHLPKEHRFVCLTDHDDEVPGVHMVDVASLKLSGWWSKMALFAPMVSRRLYFDLDTVICDDLTPLAEWGGKFGVCENFTKLAGHPSWCRYGSCVMSMAPGFGRDVWDRFWRDRRSIMENCPRGDQEAIERLYPRASLLQRELPAGYFLGYRDLNGARPPGTAVVVFAGSHKPDNCPHDWIREEWQ
jgi:hypothetical protein